MALTLVEAAKLETGDVYRQGVIETFAQSAGVMLVLPFEDITGNALRYNREEKLPGVGFRGVNEAYPESTGILNPMTEPLVIAGGDLDVDTYILQTMGANQRTVQERMKIKALSLSWERTFFTGDQTTQAREFDGLQVRVTGSQLMHPKGDDTPTSGGDPLSLYMLDALIAKVASPTHIFMSKAMIGRMTQAARKTDVGGFISYTKDDFGRQLAMYNGLPLIPIENDNNELPILGFNEVGPGGGAAQTTSIYVVSLGDGALTGIQNGEMNVRDLGELQSKPAMRTRVEWFNGIAIFNGKAVARMHGISNAPIVA